MEVKRLLKKDHELQVRQGFQLRGKAQVHAHRIREIVKCDEDDSLLVLETKSLSFWKGGRHVRKLSFPPGKSNFILSVAFHDVPDKEWIIAAAADLTLKFFDKGFNPLGCIQLDQRAIHSMVWDQRTSNLICSGVDGVYTLSISDRKVKEMHEGAKTLCSRLRFSMAKEFVIEESGWARKMIFVSEEGKVIVLKEIEAMVFDSSNGRKLHQLRNLHDQPVTDAILINELFLSGSMNGEIKVWSTCNCKPIHCFRQHTRAVTALRRHSSTSEDNLVVSSSLDSSVRVWQLDLLQELYFIFLEGPIHNLTVQGPILHACVGTSLQSLEMNHLGISFGEEQETIEKMQTTEFGEVIVKTTDGTIRLRDGTSGEPISFVIPSRKLSLIIDFYFSNSREMLFVFREGGVMETFRFQEFQQEAVRVEKWKHLPKNSCSICFSEVSFAIGTTQGHLHVHSMERGQEKIMKRKAHSSEIAVMKFIMESSELLTFNNEEMLLKKWDSALALLQTFDFTWCGSVVSSFFHVNNQIFVGFETGRLGILGEEFKELANSQDHEAAINFISSVPVPSAFATVGLDGKLKFWTMEKNLLLELDFHDAKLLSFVITTEKDIILALGNRLVKIDWGKLRNFFEN